MKVDKWLLNASGLFSVIALLSFLFFQYSTDKIESNLTQLPQAQVAGITTERKEPTDITRNTPLPPGGEITSIDKMINNENEEIIITIETKTPLTNLNEFYRDKLKNDNWEEIEKNYYAKDNQQIKVEIKGTLITLTIIKN